MLEYDPQVAVDHLAKADRTMARLIRRAGPFALEPPARQSALDSLLRAIVSQQLSGTVARAIHGRVIDLLPRATRDKPKAILDLADETLRGAGLSRAKVASIKDLAAKTLDGTVPPLAKLRRMTDEAIIERLTAVRGIGVWTVEMLLIFRLGRGDVLPLSDLGIRKGFHFTYGTADLPNAHEITVGAECWRPYRSVASWYLWRAVELKASERL